MNDTVKEIVSILDGGRPELQVAAAQILGELRMRDPVVVKSLAAAALRSHVLGRYVLEALSRIGTNEAHRVVVNMLVEHDGLIDQASHLLAEAGSVAHPAIAEVFADAPLDRRVRLLQVLSRAPSKEAVRPFVQALVTADSCEIAARLLVGAVAVPGATGATNGTIDHAAAAGPTSPVSGMSEPVAKALREALASVLDQPLPDASVAAILEVVARIDPAGARALLLHHAGDKASMPVRVAALRALVGQKLTAVQAKSFLTQLEDPAQSALHEVLREVLGAIPEWPEGLGAQLKRLLASRNQEQRLFALRAMRTSSTPELVKLALKLRDHDDPRFRGAAEDVLGTSKLAFEPLLRLLQAAKSPNEVERLAGLLGRHGPHLQPKQLRSLAERAIKLLPQKPLVADHLCDVVLKVGGAKMAPFFVEKALRWRRIRKFAEALHVLAKVASAQLLDNEGRYQLAVTRFLLDSSRPGVEDITPGNAAMGFFTVLLRDGFPLFDRLKKDTSLAPEQQLRLATYFADAVGPEKRFGAELLQHLAQRHKGRTGEEARHALRAVGF